MSKSKRGYLEQPSFTTKSPAGSAKPATISRNQGAGNSRFGHSEDPAGAFAFFYNIAVRETIESILVAIMLAFIFKMFLAEGFIIPTGSMAPSLMGAHIEITDSESGFTFPVGVQQVTRRGKLKFEIPSKATCPITGHRENSGDSKVKSGDRIMVNKFIYDFQEPERFDPIVFKYPNNGKQNYIKRLIGLPGENILLENGDVYLMEKKDGGGWTKKIARKPPSKVLNTLQVVDDTHHIGKKMTEADWPLRWQQYTGEKKWSTKNVGRIPIFSFDGNGESGWLRYRHYRPSHEDWFDRKLASDGAFLMKTNLPPRMRNKTLPLGGGITDDYAYDNEDENGLEQDGRHWVGDIGIESDIQIQGSSGSLSLDLVEGGAHFACSIDVATGKATLSCQHKGIRFVTSAGETVQTPTGQTVLQGEGKYQIRFVNADDRLLLWVNESLVKFDTAEFERDDVPLPTWSASDPGDAEPAGISASGIAVQLDRIKIVKDLYFISVEGDSEIVENRSQFEFFGDPTKWGSERCVQAFMASRGKTEPMFSLAKGTTRDKDQFLPMGDNSPVSSDARVWDGPRYVERDMLIGRAMLVYWPAMEQRPKWATWLPFAPNLKKMRFIR